MPVVADAATAAKPAVSVAKLPICGSSQPIAQICQLGHIAATAHYECANADAQVLNIYPKAVTWGCRYWGAPEPTAMTELTFDYHGKAPRDGETIKDHDPRYLPEGEIEIVSVQLKPSDAAQADELANQVLGWGCVETGHIDDSYELDCGAWQVRVSFNNINGILYFDAGHLALTRG